MCLSFDYNLQVGYDRRFWLHDRDTSGWWLPLVILVALNVDLYWDNPYVDWLVLLILFIVLGCLEGTVGPNKYGPDPKAAEREKMLTQPDEEADLDIQSDLDASSNNMDVPDENSDVNESEQEPI